MKHLALHFALVIFALVSSSAQPSEKKPYQVVIIAQSGRPDFLKSLAKGAEEETRAFTAAGRAMEIQVSEKQPTNSREQAQLLDESLSHGADAIILAPFDHHLALQSAAQKGIPIIIVDSGLEPPSPRQIVADNRAAGRLAAQCLGHLLDGKGNVILLRNQINSENTENREEGFIEVMQTSFPAIRLVATDFHAGLTPEAAGHVSDTLLHLHPDVNGIFASSQAGTQGMLQTLTQQGLAGGKVKLIGFNEGSDDLTHALQKGDIQALLTPDIAAMGKAAVRMIDPAKPVAAFTPAFPLLTPSGTPVTDPPPILTHPASAEKKSQSTNLAEGDFTIPGLNLVMLAVPPHQLALRDPTPAFWLGRYEVTQKQWTDVMGSNPSDFPGADRPVENISWNDAIEFCHRLNEREKSSGRLPKGYFYTLPTEAQWEYACRAGNSDPFDGRQPEDIGWYVSNSGSVQSDIPIWRLATHPVGQKAPNAWTFYDMHGNVSEWCLNPYDPADASGFSPVKYRVLRGGCWWTDVQNCQVDSRHKAPADRHHGGLGLRLALSVVGKD